MDTTSTGPHRRVRPTRPELAVSCAHQLLARVIDTVQPAVWSRLPLLTPRRLSMHQVACAVLGHDQAGPGKQRCTFCLAART